MNSYLRQSTASQSRAIGPFVDDTDFKTTETALTIANTDIKLIINGAASVNKNSGGGTHRANGSYGVTFDATDTGTVGEMVVSVLVSGALLVERTFFILEEAVYDQLFVASAPGAPTAAQINTEADTALSDILLDTLMKNAVTMSAVHNNALFSHLLSVSDPENFVRATMSLEQAYADAITAADINTEVDTALSDIHLDHLLAVDYDPASKPGVATALLNELVESDSGVSRYTANALEQAPSGTGASAASIRAEMDANSTQFAAIVADTNELQTDWANGGRLDNILDARASQTSVDDIPTNAELATSQAAADDATLAAIAGQNNLAAGAAMTLTSGERNAIADAIFVRTLGTEAYASDNTVPTFAQAMFMMLSKNFEMSISGTTMTCKKLDGSTAAMTFTLNSATTPTAITRAT